MPSWCGTESVIVLYIFTDITMVIFLL